MTDPNAPNQHETTDISAVGLFRSLIYLAVASAIAMLITTAIHYLLAKNQPPGEPPSRIATKQPELPPQPRLQIKPSTDLEILRAQEDRLLNGGSAIDPKEVPEAKGPVYRMPIEKAMDQIAARGGAQQ